MIRGIPSTERIHETLQRCAAPAAQRRHEAMDRIAGRLADIEHNLTSGHDEQCWTDRRDLAAFTREMLEVCLGAQARERGEVAVRVVLGAACHLGSQFDIDADLAQTEPQQPATAALSDAHGQREQLRERVAWELCEAECGLLMASDEYMERDLDRHRKVADAVLPILDEELQQLSNIASERRSLLARAERERDEWESNASDAEARADAAERHAETAEAGLVESNWPDGGPGDELARLRRENAGLHGSLASARERYEAAEQERDNLRAHVDADHQVLQQVRDHVERLREWCRDPDATVTIAGSIIADLQIPPNGDADA